MPKSRILDAAERLRTVGSTLNNPKDVAIAQQYVEDLEALATWEVTNPHFVLRAASKEERAAMLGGSLKKAFRLDHESRFSSVLNSLNSVGSRRA